MGQVNLGNVVGLLRSQTPPAKTYVIWGKILDVNTPDVVELRYYKGSGDPLLEDNWPLLKTESKPLRVETLTTDLTLSASDDVDMYIAMPVSDGNGGNIELQITLPDETMKQKIMVFGKVAIISPPSLQSALGGAFEDNLMSIGLVTSSADTNAIKDLPNHKILLDGTGQEAGVSFELVLANFRDYLLTQLPPNTPLDPTYGVVYQQMENNIAADAVENTTAVIQGYPTLLENLQTNYDGTELIIGLTCWDNNVASTDITGKITTTGGTLVADLTTTGSYSNYELRYAQALTSNTWYKLEVTLNNISTITGGSLNTPISISVVFHTNSTNDGIDKKMGVDLNFPYSAQNGLNSYTPQLGFVANGSSQLPKTYNFRTLQSLNGGNVDLDVTNGEFNTSGLIRKQLILNPEQINGTLQNCKVVEYSVFHNVNSETNSEFNESDVKQQIYIKFNSVRIPSNF